MIARFAPAPVTADTSKLAPGDKQALGETARSRARHRRHFLAAAVERQRGPDATAGERRTPLGKARLHYFEINNGPWSDLDDHAAFLPGVPAKKRRARIFIPRT